MASGADSIVERSSWPAWARGVGTGAWAALRALADIALPPTCMACRVPLGEDGGLCPSCWRAMPFIARPYCERLGTPFAQDLGAGALSPAAIADPPAFDRARAVARHEDPARHLVHLLKYRDRMDLAGPMGRMMATAGAELLADADVIVPVPLHWTRLWRRRFNQAHALARAVAAASGVPVRGDLLLRRRRTAHQVGLDRDARRRNMQGAFALADGAAAEVRGRRIVLVDDVLTTGATAEACARALSRAGAARIDVLTFGRVVDSP